MHGRITHQFIIGISVWIIRMEYILTCTINVFLHLFSSLTLSFEHSQYQKLVQWTECYKDGICFLVGCVKTVGFAGRFNIGIPVTFIFVNTYFDILPFPLKQKSNSWDLFRLHVQIYTMVLQTVSFCASDTLIILAVHFLYCFRQIFLACTPILNCSNVLFFNFVPLPLTQEWTRSSI